MNGLNLTLIVMALFLVAAFIELSYGSFYLGVIFFTLLVIILLFLKDKKEKKEFAVSYQKILFGVGLIAVVLIYNLYTNSKLQTLDSMVIIVGFSLVISNVRKLSELGKFSLYFSTVFLVFYTILFLIPENVGFDLPYYYGHYFVTLPVIYLLKNLGYDVSVHGTRIIEVNGVEPTNLKVDLACFGWYSLLLIVSMVIAYSGTVEKIEFKKLLSIILVLSLASYFTNLFRVAILVHLAYFYGVSTMLMVHPHIGWIIFSLLLLPLAISILKNP